MEKTLQWHDTPPEILGQRWTNHGDGREGDSSWLVNKVNSDQNGFGNGYSDWRMPTKEELRSLLGTPKAKGMTGVYWSSSPVVGDPSYAWVVDFDYGVVDDVYGRSYGYGYYVRLVR